MQLSPEVYKNEFMDKVIEEILNFRDARDWEQFHNPKDLALALNIESAELLESFLWKKADEAREAKVAEELADVLIYSYLLAHHYGFNVDQIILDKLKDNNEKYPIEKAKGNAKKYTEL